MSRSILTLMVCTLGPGLLAGPDYFTGNRAFPDRQLKKHLSRFRIDPTTLAVARNKDPLERAERILRHFYHDQGYLVAAVEAQSGPSFTFRISEGPRIRRANLDFEGNLHYDASLLAGLVRDPTRRDSLDEGVLRIRRHYRDNGYLTVRLSDPSIEVVESRRRDWFPLPFQESPVNVARIRIQIEEGPRYRYGRIHTPISIQGAALDLPHSGFHYSESQLVRLREDVTRHFRSRKRFLRDLQILQRLDKVMHRVDLEITYDVLPPLRIGRIEFTGHSVYPDSFYRREIQLLESDPLDPDSLESSIQSLKRTGALKSMDRDDVEIVLDPQAGHAIAHLTFHLDEKDRQGVFFSLGPDGLRNLEGSILYSIANLIGLEERLGLQLNTGSGSTQFALSMAARYFLGSALPLDLSLQFFRRNTSLRLPGVDDQLRRLFFRRSQGLSSDTTFHISDTQALQLGAVLERTSSPEPAGHLLLQPSWLASRTSPSSSHQFRLHERFSSFSGPTQSWNLRTGAEWKARWMQSDETPGRLRLRLNAETARFFGPSAPLYERLLTDGRELRGFDLSAGPWAQAEEGLIPIGGDTKLTLGSEYHLPFLRSTRLVPFLDAGINLSLVRPTSLDPVDATSRVWRSSTGSELRVPLPAGLPEARLIAAWNPVRLDRRILTRQGWARLRDPAFSFRLRF